MGTIAESSPSDEEKKSRSSSLTDVFSMDSLQDAKSELDMLFGKVKEGIKFASSHPWITGGVVIGLWKIRSIQRRKRRIRVYNETLRYLLREEPLPSRVDPKLKELRQTLDQWNAEIKNIQRRMALANEEQLIRERTKLSQARKEIQGVIKPAYKIERQAAGLKDILQELPTREASRSRPQVTNLDFRTKERKENLDEGGYKKQ